MIKHFNGPLSLKSTNVPLLSHLNKPKSHELFHHTNVALTLAFIANLTILPHINMQFMRHFSPLSDELKKLPQPLKAGGTVRREQQFIFPCNHDEWKIE